MALYCVRGEAQITNWGTAATGNWSDTTNWSNGVPGNGYNVNIINNDSVVRSVYYDVTGMGITLGNFTIDQTGSGSNTFYAYTGYPGGTFLTATYEIVGDNGQGDFENGEAMNTVTNDFYVGLAMNSSGVYNLYGGPNASLSMGPVASIEAIGQYGTGVFNNQGATNFYGTALYLGYGNTGSGTYTLIGGATGALSGTGPEAIGFNGKGTFTQSGGSTNTAGGELDIAANSGSTGSYAISGSGSTLTVNGAGLYVGGTSTGAGGTGTLTIGLGSTVSVGAAGAGGTLKVYPGAANSITLAAGGTLSAGTFDFANFSQLHWNGGTLGFLNNLIVDNIASANASFLGGSSVTLQAGENILGYGEAIGDSGSGTINQMGGTNTEDPSGELAIGAKPGSTGMYSLSGGSLIATNAVVGVGERGTGTFTQTGGAVAAPGGAVVLGDATGSMGTYTLSAGSLVTFTEVVGGYGTGVFNQSGGTNSISTGELDIGYGPSGPGTYTLSGGVFNVAGNVYVGGNSTFGAGGAGTLAVNSFGGSSLLTVTGTLAVFPGSTLSLYRSTIQTGALDLMGVYASFNWQIGTLELTNTNVVLDNTVVAPTNPLGSTLVITDLQTLIVDKTETIGGVGAGSLTVNGTNIVGGALTLTPNGILTVNAGGILSYVSFVQAGGIVNGTVTNTGSFTFQSGLFNGRLINQGTVSLGNTFTAGNGIENDTFMTVAAGQALILNGLGFDNLGSLYVTGGTIAGLFTNDYGGTMSASSGTLYQTLTNNGTLNVNGAVTVGGLVNNGQTILNAGATLRTLAAPNNGSFVNQAGGIVQGGGGAITMAFYNYAGSQVLVPAGESLSITTAWTNSGLVSLTGAGAVLGGGTIANSATIMGAGHISAAVLNSGVINASGGELDMAGTGNTNATTGQIEASNGATIVYLQGLATNAGIIALSGGTFDNNNQPMANAATGMILGSGTLKTGGLNSNGSIYFADSPSSVFGSVATTSGATITVTDNTTTFFGAVTVGSGSTFTVNKGTARFLNTFTNNGTYTSDPSTSIFTTAIVNASGTIEASTGDLYQVTGNLTNSSTQNATWSAGGATLEFTGGGTHTLSVSGPVGSYAWGTLAIDAGNTLVINGNSATAAATHNAGSLQLTAGSASLGVVTGSGSAAVGSGTNLTAYQIIQNSLTISGNGKVTLLPSGSGSTTNPAGPNNINFSSALTSLSIAGAPNAWTGTLDIGNNGLVIAYGSGTDPYATIDNMIASGYDGGSWQGTGITSTLAAAAVAIGSKVPALNIGLLDFTPGTGNYSKETFMVFEGQTITTNAILLRLTYMDDLLLVGNMTGSNSSSDALLFAANFGSGTTWSVGDITHDGTIGSSDALLFAANFSTTYPSLDGTTGNESALGGGATALGAAAALGGAPAGQRPVPEPAGMTLFALGAFGLSLLGRRRRQIPNRGAF